jgi:hypothetical protein
MRTMIWKARRMPATKTTRPKTSVFSFAELLRGARWFVTVVSPAEPFLAW